MPREPRIYIEKVLYLITAKGLEDRDLFGDHEDYAQYLRLLSESKEEYGFKLFAYCLLPKKLCLLVELKNGVTISTIMHNLSSKYTKMYNRRYGKKGHLFQSRFKSILIEKDDYLLRLTRYIHLLPKEGEVNDNLSEYLYSSYLDYASEDQKHLCNVQKPAIGSAIKEVLSYFSPSESNLSLPNAYQSYALSAGDEEMKSVQKLLHRTAFVGSEEFIQEIRNRVKDHIKKEEASKIIRRVKPGYALAGGLIVLFLAVVTYGFYKSQTGLQETLNMATNGFNAVRVDLVKRMGTLEKEIGAYEEKENYGLGGFAWELQLTPVEQEQRSQVYKDHIQFKEGKVVSAKLLARGFSPFQYTISKQTHGKMVWQTTQTSADGTTVRWYGIIAGDKMRGVYSEIPVQGTNRDFSFVSIRRLNNG